MFSERKNRRHYYVKWIFLLASVFCVVGWLFRINAQPGYDIPWTAMPRRNAFDLYVAAGKVLDRAVPIGYAAEGSVPVDWSNDGLRDKFRPCTSRDRQAILHANRISLLLFREAHRLPYVEPDARSYDAIFPYYSHYRDLCRLIVVRGREHEYQRDWEKAANDYLEIVQFGARVRDNATILDGWQVGMGCQFYGREGLQRVFGHLSSTQLRYIVHRLQSIEAQRIAYSQILQRHSYFMQSYLYSMFELPDWMVKVSYDMDYDVAHTNWTKVLRLLFVGKQGLYDNYVRGMNLGITDAALPYRKRVSPRNHGALSYNYQVDFASYGHFDARNRTAIDLLYTEMALRGYRLEFGRFPKTLHELRPKFLKRIPADSYGSGESLRYLNKGDQFVLYSIGPDGVDNKGIAIQDLSKDKPQRYIVEMDSKGDFVAGINY